MFLQIQLRQFCAAPPVKLPVNVIHLVHKMLTVHQLVNYEQDHCSEPVVRLKHLVHNLLTTVHQLVLVNSISAVKCILSATKVKVKAPATVHQLVPCEQHHCSRPEERRDQCYQVSAKLNKVHG